MEWLHAFIVQPLITETRDVHHNFFSLRKLLELWHYFPWLWCTLQHSGGFFWKFKFKLNQHVSLKHTSKKSLFYCQLCRTPNQKTVKQELLSCVWCLTISKFNKLGDFHILTLNLSTVNFCRIIYRSHKVKVDSSDILIKIKNIVVTSMFEHNKIRQLKQLHFWRK